MIRLLGRRIINGGRARGFLVEFSREWPENARRIYLVGNFTSWFPGFKRLVKKGDRGFTVLELFPGLYGYGFVVDNDFTILLDPENPDTILLPNVMTLEEKAFRGSRLELKPPTDPREYVVHDENDEAFLHRHLDYYVLRLRTNTKVSKSVLIANNEEYGASAVYETGFEKIFEHHVPAEKVGRALTYYFMVEAPGEAFSYGFNGVGERVQPFQVYAGDVKGFEKPSWYMGTVYYHVFVDSFYNADRSNDPPGTVPDTVPRRHGYLGGDLKGVVVKLDHIVSLGAEAIYLTPIFPAGTYHRYDVRDYLGVDPYLGSTRDFEELVRKAGERGVKIVLDITLHHMGVCHEFFRDALIRREDSKYWDWFVFLEKPREDFVNEAAKLLEECDYQGLRTLVSKAGYRRPFYEAFYTVWAMPRINHENPETLKYFIHVAETWVGRGVGGFRIDVAHGVMDTWLQAFYRAVKKNSEDAVIIGEVCDYPFLYKGCMDSYMNYWLRYILLGTLVKGFLSLREMVWKIGEILASHPIYQATMLYNLLGSHDTPRIIEVVDKDKTLLKLLINLLNLLPGSLAIYYGDEIGLEGGHDPDNRRPMRWNQGEWDAEVLNTYLEAIALRRKHPAVRYGFTRTWLCGDGVLVVERWLREDRVIGLFNLNEREADVSGCFEKLFEEASHRDYAGLKPLPRYGFIIIESNQHMTFHDV